MFIGYYANYLLQGYFRGRQNNVVKFPYVPCCHIFVNINTSYNGHSIGTKRISVIMRFL